MLDFNAWGIDEKYRDDSGRWYDVSEKTKSRFMAAMGANTHAPPDPALIVVRQGMETPIPESSNVRLEDGTMLRAQNKLPHDTPAGYHSIIDAEGRESRLIVAPSRCFHATCVFRAFFLRPSAAIRLPNSHDFPKENAK